MNLIKCDNSRIVIAPEAYAIKAFRDIWDKDKSKDKGNATLELGALYFMYDPRSDYQYEIDEEVRMNVIKEHTGMKASWEPSKEFTDAIPVYKYLTHTTSASILEGNRVAVKSIREVIEKPMDDLALDDVEKLAYVERLAKTVTIANKLAEDIAKAEKEIYKDVDEHSIKMRGKIAQTIGDGGVGSLFQE